MFCGNLTNQPSRGLSLFNLCAPIKNKKINPVGWDVFPEEKFAAFTFLIYGWIDVMQLSSFSLYAPSRVIIVITSSIRHSNSCTDGPFSVSRDLMKGGDNTSQLKTSTLDKNKKTIRI